MTEGIQKNGKGVENVDSRIEDVEKALLWAGGRFRHTSVPAESLKGVEAALRNSTAVKESINRIVSAVLALDVVSVLASVGGVMVGGKLEKSGFTTDAAQEWIRNNIGVVIENLQHFMPQILAAQGATALGAIAVLVVGRTMNAAIRTGSLEKALGRT